MVKVLMVLIISIGVYGCCMLRTKVKELEQQTPIEKNQVVETKSRKPNVFDMITYRSN